MCHILLLSVRCRTYLYHSSVLHSGNPAILVNSDKIPANTEADTTSFVSTCPSAVAVPMVATAVCATVLIALIPAHFAQFFQSFILDLPLFLQSIRPVCDELISQTILLLSYVPSGCYVSSPFLPTALATHFDGDEYTQSTYTVRDIECLREDLEKCNKKRG